MITESDKKKLQEWLGMNMQRLIQSDIDLIVRHIDHYFQSPSSDSGAFEEIIKEMEDDLSKNNYNRAQETIIHHFLPKLKSLSSPAPAVSDAVDQNSKCRYCGTPVMKGFNICMACADH